jgi:ArsR family transcriptional regulator, zinc-responsive transcriptional repressor
VLDRPAITEAVALFRALSHETRLTIVHRLGEGPACVHELVDDLGLSQPLVSQHLRVLRGLDLVRGTRRGKEIAYALADAHVGQLVSDALAHGAEERPPRGAVEDPPPKETAHEHPHP